MDESIHLRLFQCTLIGPSGKWYVQEKSGSHLTFESLAKTFLIFFQLPVRHDNGLELLSECKKTSTMHITNHIHEWHRRCSVGTGADLGFNTSTTHQQNPNYRPFQQHL
jgi:hypothetical protein